MVNFLLRNENRFLLAGLKVERLADWEACQAAYSAAVKDFIKKLKPDFAESVEIRFVKGTYIGRGQDQRIFMSADCAAVEQYVLTV